MVQHCKPLQTEEFNMAPGSSITFGIEGVKTERDIRMIKLKQKISGCFRSEKYASYFLRIRRFISTMNKHGLDVLDSIKRIFANPHDFNLVIGCN